MNAHVQQLCADGQRHLLDTDYLAAERSLVEAEAIAYEAEEWDTLARLYMPLQEARRQRRQRAGEGIVKLDLVARNASESIDVSAIAAQYPHGQLLVAGFGTLAPALQLREIAQREDRYLDVFLAASYWVAGSVVVAIVPDPRVTLPEDGEYSLDTLQKKLPPHSLLIPLKDLPSGEKRGDTQTFAHTMSLWEQLHLPYLAAADNTQDLRRRVDGYRHTINVDYACELAHQKLSNTARELERARRAART